MKNGYLIRATEVYRLETVEEVERFHEILREDPSFHLISFGYKDKNVKVKGEIIDEWKNVTVVKAFNDEKEPDTRINIIYEKETFDRSSMLEELSEEKIGEDLYAEGVADDK